MDWIVTTGATIDTALESALDELSVTHDDVEYENFNNFIDGNLTNTPKINV